MKKVFIKYNPYSLETEVTVDGKSLAQNSKLGERIIPGSRLQEWVEDLPGILIEEYNDSVFDVKFHGTLLDYDDLREVFTKAYERGELDAKLERIPAKETADKEALIDQVFQEIQRGPFKELTSGDEGKALNSAFRNAKSGEFEVCVVATMSAGKSTLINAMLGTKLMPSKMEACTAIITRIKDVDLNCWEAEVYDKNDKLTESYKELTYEAMERLNGDEKVSMIKINGKIPFVSSKDVSLVLIDTPGPDNARNKEHARVQKDFLNASSKSLVLYIMEGTFGSDADDELLSSVAESMKVGGKQSKDRFIFVVNKMDDRKKEDGDTEQTLNNVRAYLRKHDIINPNLFPAAALPALNIRLIANGAEVDVDTLDETEVKARKLNRNDTLHLEKYASLPPSLRGGINDQLAKIQSAGNDAQAEALIHTGVVSVEAAIQQYVQKYAKTAKIKNIVDTFMHKLVEVGCLEKTKKELAKNEKERDKIAATIANIRKNVDDAKAAKKFQKAVDDAVRKVDDEANEMLDEIVQKYQNRITRRIDSARGNQLRVYEAEEEVEKMEKFARDLESSFQSDFDQLIKNNLIQTGKMLLEEYKKKLASLVQELGTGNLSGISIEPLKLMGDSVRSDDFSIQRLIQTKKVEDGQEWVEVPRPPIFGLGIRDFLFGMKKELRTKYKNVSYVDEQQLAEEFFTDISERIFDNRDIAYDYVKKQSRKIADRFHQEFQHLDNVLKKKLVELESYASDQEKAQERVKESERKLEWLEYIQLKVASILEI